MGDSRLKCSGRVWRCVRAGEPRPIRADLDGGFDVPLMTGLSRRTSFGPRAMGGTSKMSEHGYIKGLRLRPWTVKREAALEFVAGVHRRLPKIQGAMWCTSVRHGTEIVAVALVGWPSQEQTNDEMDHLRVLRVAAKEGYKNACSMLYSACWRAGRALGADSMDTFTHLDEPGTSLRASGWIEDGVTDGGEYDRPSRRRKAQVDSQPKRRWWAPGSLKAPKTNASKGEPKK